MKKNIVQVLLFAISFNVIVGTCKSIGVPEDDAYIQGFVQAIPNPLVKVQKGNVLLYADVSTSQMVMEGLMALAAGGAAVACAYLPVRHNDEAWKEYLLVGVLGAVAVGCGVACGKDIERTMSKVPYYVLSNKGLFIEGRKQFEWKAISSIEVEKTTVRNQQGFVTGEYKTAYFKDAYGTMVATVASYDFLAIPMDNFYTIASYYWKNNTQQTQGS